MTLGCVSSQHCTIVASACRQMIQHYDILLLLVHQPLLMHPVLSAVTAAHHRSAAAHDILGFDKLGLLSGPICLSCSAVLHAAHASHWSWRPNTSTPSTSNTIQKRFNASTTNMQIRFIIRVVHAASFARNLMRICPLLAPSLHSAHETHL